MAVVTLNSTATLFAASAEATYASARAGGPNLYASEYGWIGQYFGGSYEVNQVFARFDLSGLPANALITGAKLILTVPESYGSHTVEVREAPAFTAGNAAAFIPGTGLAARTLLGSTAFVGAFGITREVVLSNFTRAGLANVVLHGAAQRTGTAPTGDTTTRVDTVKLEVTYVIAVYLTTTGAQTWTVPADVTNLLTIGVHGAGGGGNPGGGRSGGGGAYSQITNRAVTPGQVINAFVGAPGVGLTNGGNTPGGDTWFVSNTTVMAKGGFISTTYTGGAITPAQGGAGQASAGVGTIKFSGGGGHYSNAGGGGAATINGDGASAGTTGTSANAFGSPAGSGGAPRTIGTGSTSTFNTAPGIDNVFGGSGGATGSNGGNPGGGGGVGTNSGNFVTTGGRGLITITYEPPAPLGRLQRNFSWL